MKRLYLPLTLMIFWLASAPGYADTLFYGVNTGSGDNFGYIGEMNGHPFALSGGTNYWFFGMEGFDPGSGVGGQTELFLYSTTVWINGAPVDLMFPSPSATLFMSGFTLPTNGLDFRVFVQIGFTAAGINWELPQPVELSGSGSGWIDFYFSNGRYYASNFVPAAVPEPGTFALLGTGLIGLFALVTRRFRT